MSQSLCQACVQHPYVQHFLGFEIRVVKPSRAGKEFPLIRPSQKAMKHIRAEIRQLTCKRNYTFPEEIVIGSLNDVARGG